MTSNWSKAAKKYRAAEAAKQITEQDQTAAVIHDRIVNDEVQRRQTADQLADIDRGAAELEQFIRIEGQALKELLSASKRHINFGEEREGGGYGVVYFIDGNGLQQSVEAMGMWTAYSKDVPKPVLTPISAHEAVTAAVYHGGKKATEVVNWLRGELDKIASSAPAIE